MAADLTIEKFEYVPGRIDAAMRFVEHCRMLTESVHCCGGSTQGRDLCASERAAYEAALNAMRLYFAGEMDFGGAPMRLPDPPATPPTPEPDAPAKEGKLCKACRKARKGDKDE
jgi:hypothetical protein